MIQGIDNCIIISDDCHDNRGEELIHEPTGDETMERCLMNQNEDDHSGGQEETRRLCYDIVNECRYGHNRLS